MTIAPVMYLAGFLAGPIPRGRPVALAVDAMPKPLRPPRRL